MPLLTWRLRRSAQTNTLKELRKELREQSLQRRMKVLSLRIYNFPLRSSNYVPKIANLKTEVAEAPRILNTISGFLALI